MLKHTNVLKAEWYYFLAVCIYSLNCEMFSESVFRLVCKSKIGETVVDSARHSFSRRRALAHQLFAKYLFDELNDTILFSAVFLLSQASSVGKHHFN